MPTQTLISILAFVVICVAATAATLIFRVIAHAIASTAWPTQQKRTATVITAIVLTAWLLLSIYLSLNNAINVNIQALAPILIGIVLLIISPAFKQISDHLPTDGLIRLHGLRLSSVGYVLLGLAGVVPLAFGLMAGIGDMVIGASALAVSSKYAQNPAQTRGLTIAWSILGILDIVVGRVLGLTLGVKLPAGITLSPTFSVPLVIIVHILILRALPRKSTEAMTPGSLHAQAG